MNQCLMKFLAVLLLLLTPVLAMAQSYPARSITFLTPFPPGGGTDVSARMLAQKLAAILGVNVVVENRGGASGNIGTAQFVKLPADGYNLLFTAQSPITIAPSLYPKLPFDPGRDLVPLAITQWTPLIVVSPKSLPADTLQELVTLSASQPGKLFYASPGTGNELHLLGAWLRQELKADLTHVPYKGSGPALVDLVAGRTHLLVASPSSVRQYLADGRLKALATLSQRRLGSLPNVPTASESGFPVLTAEAWFGLFAPVKTPQAVMEKIFAAVQLAAQDNVYQQQIRGLGMEPAAVGSAEFQQLINRYRGLWSDLIRSQSITPEDG